MVFVVAALAAVFVFHITSTPPGWQPPPSRPSSRPPSRPLGDGSALTSDTTNGGTTSHETHPLRLPSSPQLRDVTQPNPTTMTTSTATRRTPLAPTSATQPAATTSVTLIKTIHTSVARSAVSLLTTSAPPHTPVAPTPAGPLFEEGSYCHENQQLNEDEGSSGSSPILAAQAAQLPPPTRLIVLTAPPIAAPDFTSRIMKRLIETKAGPRLSGPSLAAALESLSGGMAKSASGLPPSWLNILRALAPPLVALARTHCVVPSKRTAPSNVEIPRLCWQALSRWLRSDRMGRLSHHIFVSFADNAVKESHLPENSASFAALRNATTMLRRVAVFDDHQQHPDPMGYGQLDRCEDDPSITEVGSGHATPRANEPMWGTVVAIDMASPSFSLSRCASPPYQAAATSPFDAMLLAQLPLAHIEAAFRLLSSVTLAAGGNRSHVVLGLRGTHRSDRVCRDLVTQAHWRLVRWHVASGMLNAFRRCLRSPLTACEVVPAAWLFGDLREVMREGDGTDEKVSEDEDEKAHCDVIAETVTRFFAASLDRNRGPEFSVKQALGPQINEGFVRSFAFHGLLQQEAAGKTALMGDAEGGALVWHTASWPLLPSLANTRPRFDHIVALCSFFATKRRRALPQDDLRKRDLSPRFAGYGYGIRRGVPSLSPAFDGFRLPVGLVESTGLSAFEPVSIHDVEAIAADSPCVLLPVPWLFWVPSAQMMTNQGSRGASGMPLLGSDRDRDASLSRLLNTTRRLAHLGLLVTSSDASVARWIVRDAMQSRREFEVEGPTLLQQSPLAPGSSDRDGGATDSASSIWEDDAFVLDVWRTFRGSSVTGSAGCAWLWMRRDVANHLPLRVSSIPMSSRSDQVIPGEEWRWFSHCGTDHAAERFEERLGVKGVAAQQKRGADRDSDADTALPWLYPVFRELPTANGSPLRDAFSMLLFDPLEEKKRHRTDRRQRGGGLGNIRDQGDHGLQLADVTGQYERFGFRRDPLMLMDVSDDDDPATSAVDGSRRLNASLGASVPPPRELRGGIRLTWAGYCCYCCGFSNEVSELLYAIDPSQPARASRSSPPECANSDAVERPSSLIVRTTLAPHCHCQGQPLRLRAMEERLYVDPATARIGSTSRDDAVAWASHILGELDASAAGQSANRWRARFPDWSARDAAWLHRYPRRRRYRNHVWDDALQRKAAVPSVLDDAEGTDSEDGPGATQQPTHVVLQSVMNAVEVNSKRILAKTASSRRRAKWTLTPPPLLPIDVWVYHTDPVTAAALRESEAVGAFRDHVIIRAMYEFSRIPHEWAARMNADRTFQEVWVPSVYVRDAFAANDVSPEKVFVIPEPIDTFRWSPRPRRRRSAGGDSSSAATAEEDEEADPPIQLPLMSIADGSGQRHHPNGGVVLNPGRRRRVRPEASWEFIHPPMTDDHASVFRTNAFEAAPKRPRTKKPFVFLSVFKWESRKGYDVLFDAFIGAFRGRSDVALVVLTRPWSPEPVSVEHYIKHLIAATSPPTAVHNAEAHRRTVNSSRRSGSQAGDEARRRLPHIEVILEHLSEDDVLRLYRSVDAFVLPTRGEGWGLPVIQAMAVGLPTIATNHSGIVDFLHPKVAFPIAVEKLETVPSGPYGEAMVGRDWAVPSTAHLVQLMRFVADPANRDFVARKGRGARRHVARHFSTHAVGCLVAKRLAEIEQMFVP